MDAAVEVLRRNEGSEATVADILNEAGLSTRAFYRHFEGKEDVVRAIFERDAESFGLQLRRHVEQANDPAAGVVAWIDEMLSLAYDRRRRARMAAFSSRMVMTIVAGTGVQSLGQTLLVEPLHDVLVRGHESGAFALVEPDADVWMINALTWEAIGAVQSGRSVSTRHEALDQVLRFVLPALGAAPAG